MPTPKKGYFVQDGTKVPSVTTILSRYKESGALMYWCWQQGKDGKDFRETKQAAADAGTAAHEMIEQWKLKQPFDASKYKPEILAKAQGAFSAFLEWANQTKLEIIQTEVGLVSERYRFGGTLDAMLVQGNLALGDWKTSGGVYPDYLMQLAAYHQLWTENFPDKPITGGVHLLRFSKQEHPDDPISFAHHYWSDVTVALKLFLLLREAYDLDKRVKKMV
jgi:hypothetical protein